MAEEAGIFVPSGTQAGKAGMKLKNDEIAPEALSAWRSIHNTRSELIACLNNYRYFHDPSEPR